MNRIVISKDFSETPGGRFKHEGPFSGEEFRDSLLLPKYEKSLKKSEQLEIDFDDCFGFATSFLEEAFGGLVRVHRKRNVFKQLIIVSKDDETIPYLVEK